MSAVNLTLPGYQKYTGTSGKSLKRGCRFLVSDEIRFYPRDDLNISHFDNNSEYERNDTELLEYLTDSISNMLRKEKRQF